jgi:hypothetical protein
MVSAGSSNGTRPEVRRSSCRGRGRPGPCFRGVMPCRVRNRRMRACVPVPGRADSGRGGKGTAARAAGDPRPVGFAGGSPGTERTACPPAGRVRGHRTSARAPARAPRTAGRRAGTTGGHRWTWLAHGPVRRRLGTGEVRENGPAGGPVAGKRRGAGRGAPGRAAKAAAAARRAITTTRRACGPDAAGRASSGGGTRGRKAA